MKIDNKWHEATAQIASAFVMLFGSLAVYIIALQRGISEHDRWLRNVSGCVVSGLLLGTCLFSVSLSKSSKTAYLRVTSILVSYVFAFLSANLKAIPWVVYFVLLLLACLATLTKDQNGRYIGTAGNENGSETG